MNIKKINHIGIVVSDLERGKRKFGGSLGLKFLREEHAEEFACRIAFYHCGEVMIELIVPTGPGPSLDFLLSHGEGLHHICYEVDDIDAALADAGATLKTDYTAAKIGAGGARVFFLDPGSICGVETEFVELKK